MHMAYGVNFHNNVAMRGERVCYIFRIALLGEVSIVGSTWHLHLHLTDLISRESLGSSEHIFILLAAVDERLYTFILYRYILRYQVEMNDGTVLYFETSYQVHVHVPRGTRMCLECYN